MFALVSTGKKGKTISLKLRYSNFEPSLKLRWCRAQDLLGSQIPVTTRGFDLRTVSNLT